MEEWKDVVGYEGLYQVSNQGRIKSMSKKVGRNGGFTILSEKIMSLKTDKDKYKYVGLRKDGKKKFYRVHRLELLAFKGLPPNENDQGLHLDDDPSNNFLENLKWGTQSENMQLAVAHGRRPIIKHWSRKTGELNPRSVRVLQLTTNDEVVREYCGIAEAARLTSINRSSISACCLGKQNHSGGFKWKYVA